MADISTLALSRRAFLTSVCAATILPALPTVSIATPAAPAARALLPMFAVGTPGEYDWQAYSARTAEEAFKEWVAEHYGDEDEGEDDNRPHFDPDYVQRVAQWDGKRPSELSPADWIDANMGHCCERCDCETHANMGAHVVAGEVVCADCLTLADKIEVNEDDALDELTNLISDTSPDEVRQALTERGDWQAIPTDLWQRAVIQAERYTQEIAR